MQRIYFDESGQTGAHLLDADQPFFCIASTDIQNAEAEDMLKRHFPARQGKELKAQRLLGQVRGRRELLRFLSEFETDSSRVCTVKIDKRFTVVAKMVDHLVEPVLRDQGYDFYKDDYAVKFANTTFYVFDNLIPPAVTTELLRQYNDFARKPNATRLYALNSALRSARADAPFGSEVPLDLMIIGTSDFRRIDGADEFDDTNDIHVTAVLRCMSHWQQRGPGPFEVIHDESNHFFKRSERWQAITNPALEPMILSVGDRTLTLPVPVTSTISARSHETPSLQVCDLIAGVIGRYRSNESSGEMRDFFSAAASSGLGQISIYPVEAGTDFIASPPARAEGPDIIDRIAAAVRKGLRG
ncbi:DUF3800 domain-containing protein [Xanthobacter variabilis]|uniref:DUF3800 domain-containing protein n=1 Tax=Xanthobacter variabilis TaxID=3119932 RepID=UPI00372C4D3C